MARAVIGRNLKAHKQHPSPVITQLEAMLRVVHALCRYTRYPIAKDIIVEQSEIIVVLNDS